MDKSVGSIEEDNVFFERLANLVPPNIYFNEETRRQITGQKFALEEEEEEPMEVPEEDNTAPVKKQKKKYKDKKEVTDVAEPPKQVQSDKTDDGIVYDYKRLYVRGLQPSVTKEALEQMFPSAIKIDLKKRKPKQKDKLNACLVSYDTTEAAKLARDTHQGRIYQVMFARQRHGGDNTDTGHSQNKKRKAESSDTNIVKAKKQKTGQSSEKKEKKNIENKVLDKPFHLKTVTEIQEALYTKENERNHKKEMKAKLKETKMAPQTSIQADTEIRQQTAVVYTGIKEKAGTDALTELSNGETSAVGQKNVKVKSKKEKKLKNLDTSLCDTLTQVNGTMEKTVTSPDGKSTSPAKKPHSPLKSKVSVSQTVTKPVAVPLSPQPAAVQPKPVAGASSSSDTVLPVPSGVPAGTLSDNRAKLHAKIAELQAKRKMNDPERQQKLMRRREKKQQQKLLKKQKKKEKKKGVKAEGGSVQTGGTVKEGVADKKSPVKQVLNKDGQTVFSKFDFSESSKKEKKKGTSLTGKDYKTLLGKIEKRNEKINNLKSKDETAAKQLEDKFKWEAAINKAEGIKVKDNPEVLKKALKKKEHMKKIKKKKWDSRVEHTQKMKDAKQAKRNKNIEERKQANKDKKMKKLKKKGRIIPGF